MARTAMHTLVGPKKASGFELMITLEATSGGAIKTTPTIAAGDFKLSKDGGAIADPNTLPAETPAGSGLVKIVLDATEMDADVVVVRWKDAAGGEWEDGSVCIITRDVTVDELVRSTTPANSLDVAATGEAGVDLSNVKLPSTATTLTNVTIPNVTEVGETLSVGPGAISDESFAAGAITDQIFDASAVGAIWDALTSGLSTSGSIGKFLVDQIGALVDGLGAFDGVGANTVKGYLLAMALSSATKPTDFGTFTGASQSLQPIGIQAADIGSTALPMLQSILDQVAALGYAVVPAVALVVDNAAGTDELTVVFYDNNGPMISVTSVTLTLYQRSTGNVHASGTMTKIGTTPAYKLDLSGASRLVAGESYVLKFVVVNVVTLAVWWTIRGRDA